MTQQPPATGKLSNRFAISPAIDPKLPIDAIIDLGVRNGFQSMEVMTSWALASVDVNGNAGNYRDMAAAKGIAITSFHMPQIKSDDTTSLEQAVQSLQFAKDLGAEVVIYKADSFEAYGWGAQPVLDRAEKLGLEVIIYNHANSIIATIEDYRKALDAIDDDRIGVLLEVGHFHAAGVDWQEALNTFGDRIKLVHFKDMRGDQPVPYGTGEIDFDQLFRALRAADYRGRMVLELEKVPPGEVAAQLQQAVAVAKRAWETAALT